MDLKQAKQYLNSLGIEIPDFLLQAWLDDINDRKDCLEDNYTSGQIIELYTLLLALKVSATGGRYVSSQSISGALSRSFRYKSDEDLWNGLINSIKLLDKKGCLDDLVPENPYQEKVGFVASFRSKRCMR